MAFSKDEPAPEGQRSDFEEKLAAFVEICQGLVNQHWKANGYTHAPEPRITVDSRGKRYVRLTRVERGHDGSILSGSAYCFIDRVTGDVFKPDGFTRPAKGIRGNIFASAPGEGMSFYGTASLRRGY